MRAFLVWFVLIVSLLPSHAQETEAPWPPDPSVIFSPNVEIVEARLHYPPSVDNSRREVQVYDSEINEWRAYPYPDDISSVDHVREWTDGTLLVAAAQNHAPGTVWMLDLQTGQYHVPEFYCGQMKTEAGKGEWVWFTDTDGKVYACFTETGELSSPLPDDLTWVAAPHYVSTELSPDGKWFLYVEFQFESSGYNRAAIYVYDFRTQNRYPLGIINPRFAHTYLGHWLDETKIVVINQEGPEVMPAEYYVADVTQPNSLQYVLPRRTNSDREPRLEYLTTTGFLEWKFGSEVAEHQPCQLQLYEPATGLRHFELGYDCAYANAIRASGNYYYVRIDGPDAEFSTLAYLHLQTEAIRNVFTGEIESLDSISPGGRYAVLQVHDNHKIDVVDTFDHYLPINMNPHVVIVDLEAEAVVYAGPDTSSRQGALWLDDTHALVFVSQSFSSIQDYIQLVELGEAGYTARALWKPPSMGLQKTLSPNKLRLLTDTIVIDFEALQVYSVLNADVGSSYIFTTIWQDNDLIRVTIKPKSDYSPTAEYVVRLP